MDVFHRNSLNPNLILTFQPCLILPLPWDSLEEREIESLMERSNGIPFELGDSVKAMATHIILGEYRVQNVGSRNPRQKPTL